MADLEAQRASVMVRKETTINTAVTALIAVILTWLIFRKVSLIDPLGPPPTGVFGILPGTFNFTLLVTIALTLITRKRVNAGLYARVSSIPGSYGSRMLPKNVILRGVVLALAATLVFVSMGLLVTWAAVRAGVWPSPWSFAGIAVFFTGYFVLLSLVVTPIILRRALAD